MVGRRRPKVATHFCPLFDTVVVKWKGELGAGLVMTPLHVQYGGEGAFGGHGYNVTSTMLREKPYVVAVSVGESASSFANEFSCGRGPGFGQRREITGASSCSGWLYTIGDRLDG